MITFLIASVGRPCLKKALDSIELWPDDELIVVGNMGGVVDDRVTFLPLEPQGDYGHSERNYAQTFCHGRYVAHLDDDDTFAPGHRTLMEDAMQTGQPTIFRMRYPSGFTLWYRSHYLASGNIGTPMFFFPNDPLKLGTWGSFHGGDFHFANTCQWPVESYIWRGEVIAHIGRNQNEPYE